MKKHLAAILAFCVLSASGFAGSTNITDQLLDHLVGRWTLTGTIANKKNTHDVTAEWILNHGYVRLHEASREKDSSGAPAYEAIIFVCAEPNGGDYTCLWLDSTGSWGLSPQAMGRAKRQTNSIPFVFKDPDGAVSFENTFVYDPAADSWSWVMDNVHDGKRKPFGRVTLAKP
jgi:hypothetical protein